jgi:hypothetical protein
MRRLVAAALISLLGLTACSSADRSPQAFCEQLQLVTGPEGAEVALLPGDAGRVDAIVDELQRLLERSPDDISTTVSSLIDFFEAYQLEPRESRRDLLVERQEQLAAASQRLDAYALENCGLFLQRAVPTPIATSDPGIEATE